MARPKKENTVGKIEFEVPVETGEILLRLADLEKRVADLEAKKEVKKTSVNLVQKVEDFNGEAVPPKGNSMADYSYEDKLQNMKNIASVLPPNFIKDGRHSLENIQAYCCFPVTEEMVDDLYADFSHEV